MKKFYPVDAYFSWEKNARMMYRAGFSTAPSSFGWMRFPQKTWNPECRHVESMAIIFVNTTGAAVKSIQIN